MTYSNRMVGDLVPGRWASFISAVVAASALGTGGCSLDFSAGCAPGQTCRVGPTTTNRRAAGEIAPSATAGASGSANPGPAVGGGAGALDTDSDIGAGGSSSAAAAPAANAGGAAGSTDEGSSAGASTGGAPGASAGGSGACAPGFEDCNGDPADGCEVDTRSNADNCGACGFTCSADGVRARSCVAGACAPTCLDYRGDCFPDANDGCETSLASPWNCGACGRDCGRGSCLADARCGTVDIAPNVRGVSRVAVTSDTVYWSEISDDDSKTTVHGASRIDGQPSPRTFETSRRVFDVTSVGDELYMTFGATDTSPLDGAVARWVPGEQPQDVVTEIAPAFVAATTDAVYWTDIVHKAVFRAGRDGANPTQVTEEGDLPFGLTANGDTVFGSTTGGRVFWANATQGNALGSVPAAQSAFVAVDGPNVFAWTSNGHGGSLGRYDTKLTMSPDIILTEPTTDSLGRGLAAAAGEVFFARTDGIYRIAETGGDPRLLVDTTDIVLQLVARDHTLYWVELGADRQTGSVRSVNFY